MKDIVITITAITSVPEHALEKPFGIALQAAVREKMAEENLPQHRVDVTVTRERVEEVNPV